MDAKRVTDELVRLLEDSDGAVGDWAERHSGRLRAALGEAVATQVLRHVRAFDFDDALVALRATLGEPSTAAPEAASARSERQA